MNAVLRDFVRDNIKDNTNEISTELKEAFIIYSLKEAQKVVDCPSDKEEVDKVVKQFYKMLILGAAVYKQYTEK